MTERIWLSSYPAGIPADIDVKQYTSLVVLMDASFKQYAKRPAYHFMGKDISFAQTDSLSQAFAAYLQSLGLVKGDRVAIMMLNMPQYPVAVAGILRGAVVVDVGAAAKLRDEGKSLLPIGMTGVEGDFSRGDVIAVRDVSGAEIARGLANYSSSEARLICRKPSSEYEKLLGYSAGPEMLHRDNLVLTR